MLHQNHVKKIPNVISRIESELQNPINMSIDKEMKLVNIRIF